MDNERHVPIDTHPHYYVSSEGRVLNSKLKEKTLQNNRDGYLKVTLYENGRGTTKRVHRMVAEAFVPNPDNKPDVNHKDGNKHNNSVDNLEWVTKSENMKHAYRTGLAKPSYGMSGRKNPNGGRRGHKVCIVETGETFNSITECAEAIGGNDGHISECLNGKQRTHCGYHFQLV